MRPKMKQKIVNTAKFALAAIIAFFVSGFVLGLELLVIGVGLFGAAIGDLLGRIFSPLFSIEPEVVQRLGAVIGLIAIVSLLTAIYLSVLNFTFGNERRNFLGIIVLQLFGMAVGAWVGQPGGLRFATNSAIFGAIAVGTVGAFVMSPAVKFVLHPRLKERVVGELERLYLGLFKRLSEVGLDKLMPAALKRKAAQLQWDYESDAERVKQSLWILESLEGMTQGTAFHLSGVGLVTCHHVLGPGIDGFRADNVSQKFPITVENTNEDIDLAIVSVNTSLQTNGLNQGSADSLAQMDELIVAGFPNYREGDTVHITKGIVSGFRTVSGIRRILTDAPIVAGVSGGPVFDKDYNVIGVAVTGADRMEEAQDTEYHSVIPIEALRYLLKS